MLHDKVEAPEMWVLVDGAGTVRGPYGVSGDAPYDAVFSVGFYRCKETAKKEAHGNEKLFFIDTFDVVPGLVRYCKHLFDRSSNAFSMLHDAFSQIRELKKAGTADDPDRYSHGEVECIDAIRSALTEDEFRGFCKGNVIKYTWREAHKGGDSDLEKAARYLGYME